nr:putrescine-ornithine antiporter [Vibrio cholerae]
MYSFYALYSSGETAVMLGSIATFFGWVLYGAIYRSQQNTPLKHA